MKLPKSVTTITPLSKFLALTLFILFPFIGFYFGMGYQKLADYNNQPQDVNTLTTVLNNQKKTEAIKQAISNKQDVNLCNFTISLPVGYYLQNPINSFFGNSSTEQHKGVICKVILGPNYKAQYEGFSGEQIQINVYSVDSTKISELTKLNNSTDNYLPLHAYRFTRPSYGGKDEMLVFEKDNKIYEIIWRNQPNDIENIVKKIIVQL